MLPAETEQLLHSVSETLHISEDILLRRGLRTVVEQQLRAIQASIFEITGSYRMSSSEEMEKHYEMGLLEEAESWRDWQHLDHLECKRDRLMSLLELLS